jgi:hypothetical protein
MHDRRQDRAHGAAAARQQPPRSRPRGHAHAHAARATPSPLSGGVRRAATPVSCLGWAVNYQRNKPAGAGAVIVCLARTAGVLLTPMRTKKKKHAGAGRAQAARADDIDQPRRRQIGGGLVVEYTRLHHHTRSTRPATWNTWRSSRARASARAAGRYHARRLNGRPGGT